MIIRCLPQARGVDSGTSAASKGRNAWTRAGNTYSGLLGIRATLGPLHRTKVPLRPGLTALLYGLNGAGKSSVLEAARKAFTGLAGDRRADMSCTSRTTSCSPCPNASTRLGRCGFGQHRGGRRDELLQEPTTSLNGSSSFVTRSYSRGVSLRRRLGSARRGSVPRAKRSLQPVGVREPRWESPGLR